MAKGMIPASVMGTLSMICPLGFLPQSVIISECMYVYVYTSLSLLEWLVGTMDIDVKKEKLSEIRDRIEYNRSGHMNRRTIMFGEALFIMSRLPNYYGRPKMQLTKWQFGYVAKATEDVKMIHPESENKTLYEMVPDLFNTDLVIVPLSQIPPEFDNLPLPTDEEQEMLGEKEATYSVESSKNEEIH